MNWANLGEGIGIGVVGMLGVCGYAAWYVSKNPAFLVKRMMRAGRRGGNKRGSAA